MRSPSEPSSFDQELRDDEQRDALHAGRSAGDLGQHQVDDVLGQLVVAAGDPHLVAGQPVGAVVLGLGPRGDVGQRRAGLRLRQRHRAEPAALELGPDVGVDLLLAAVGEQQAGVAHREERIGRRADVGRLEPGEHGLADGVRQLHAAVLLVERAGHQPGVGEHLQRLRRPPGSSRPCRRRTAARSRRPSGCAARSARWRSARRGRGRRRRSRGSARRTAGAWSATRRPATRAAGSPGRGGTGSTTQGSPGPGYRRPPGCAAHGTGTTGPSPPERGRGPVSCRVPVRRGGGRRRCARRSRCRRPGCRRRRPSRWPATPTSARPHPPPERRRPPRCRRRSPSPLPVISPAPDCCAWMPDWLRSGTSGRNSMHEEADGHDRGRHEEHQVDRVGEPGLERRATTAGSRWTNDVSDSVAQPPR